MKILFVVVLAALSMTTLSGCAELFTIKTIEQMQRSEYHAEYASTKTSSTVTECMMETLYKYTNAKGTRQYAEATAQTFGTTHTIILRNRIYGGGDEMLFLIENSGRDGGTKSNMWVTSWILSPSPKEYLDTVAGVVRVCL